MKVKIIKKNGYALRETQYGSCIICKRPLTKPESVARGMGPVCAGKQARKDALLETSQPHLWEPLTEGFIFRRENGALATNVPPLVVHHSPTGFEIGYGGSGPADLALNICELLLRRMGYRGATHKCWDGNKCFAAAWSMHQAFKFEFIAPMHRDGGKIGYDEARAWVNGRLETYVDEALMEARTDYA